jgi:putative transposase
MIKLYYTQGGIHMIRCVKTSFKTGCDDLDRLFQCNRLYLSMGIENGRRRKPINLSVAKPPSYPIKEIELIYDRKLMLSISYDDGIKPSENNNTNKYAVDLGEIHSIASYCDNGEAIIITGRKQRSIHRLRNKKLAELQKLMSKSDNQLRDCAHKISKQFVDWCRSNGKILYIGDISNIKYERIA